MLIEFCCPVCKAPLAINKQVIGGQVNCPSCQKLILLPAESPLKRKQADIPPFNKEQLFEAGEVAQAICISVEPYRRDLESKSNLLNDAVEMVKIRNDRIREIETLMLNTQKELWEHEAEILDRNQELADLQSVYDAVSQRPPEADPAQTEALQTLTEKKDRLKARLQNMVAHSENLETKLKDLREMVRHDGPARLLVDHLRETLAADLEQQEAQNRDLDLAADYLRQAAGELARLQQRLAKQTAERQSAQELIKSSGNEIQLALAERDQWRNKYAEMEKKFQEQVVTLERLKIQAAESEKLQREHREDRDHSKRLRTELEENLSLLRSRLEQERTHHQQILDEREQKLKAEAAKKIGLLDSKLKAANAELCETEEKLAVSLQTQQQLAEQNMQGEQQRRKLKAALEALQDQLNG